MSHARHIPDAPPKGLFRRTVYTATQRKLGRLPSSVAATAHSSAILAGMCGFELALERAHRVPHRIKDLAEIKAATIVGCEFCMDIGSWVGRGHGITDQELLALARHNDHPELFDERDRLALDLADAMSRVPVEVPEPLIAALREHFDDAQLVELMGAIAWENFRARFNAGAGLGADGFSEGAVCAMPERAAGETQPAAVT